jgi:hypothetical protein
MWGYDHLKGRLIRSFNQLKVARNFRRKEKALEEGERMKPQAQAWGKR